MSSPHGQIWWTELNTWNPDEALKWYGAVMGWTFTEAPTAAADKARPYYIAMKDGRPVAGIFTLIKPNFDGIPDHWFTYIAVENLEKTLAHSLECGGKTLREPFEIPGMGKMCVHADSTGAVMGLIEPTHRDE